MSAAVTRSASTQPAPASPDSPGSPGSPERERVDVAALLRAVSADDHRATENRGYITRLMAGELDLADYSRYLAQYAYIYEALESRTVGAEGPAVFDPALRRFARIESDLAALGAAGWRDRWTMLPATRRYVERLRALVDSADPLDTTTRYLAHHYARYLGDLSGGQAVAVLMARHYGATPEQLSFYDFSALGSVVHAKRESKERMNALAWDAESLDAITDEVLRAFRFNAAVFDELDQPGEPG